MRGGCRRLCFAVQGIIISSDVEVAEAASRNVMITSPGGETGSPSGGALSNAKAPSTLGRGGDLTSRVLGAGVVKRYEGRSPPVA